jgi:phosphate transport system permease protein
MRDEDLMTETQTAAARPLQQSARRVIDIKRRTRPFEAVVRGALVACGLVSIFTTLGILYVLGSEAFRFFTSPGVRIQDFLTTTRWAPEGELFGVLPLVTATLTTSFIAMCVAIPIGLAAAIFLSEYASPRASKLLKPVLELLAGIPTVVYGYFALTTVTPFLRSVFGQDTIEIYNMLSAGLVMGIMIVPLVGSISEDALSAVPRSLREASLGLGATKLETTFRVVVPAALSGILAGVIIGISRAVGETMIVSLASGAGPNFTLNPVRGAETMTGHIARISSGDLSYESLDYLSLYAIGLTLFVITFVLNLISRYFVRRFREAY